MFSPNQQPHQSPESQRATFLREGYLIVEGTQVWGPQKNQIIERCHQEIQRLADHGYSLVDQDLIAQPGAKPTIKDTDPRAQGCRYVFDRAETDFLRANLQSTPAVLKLVNGVGTFSEDLGNATRHPNLLKVFGNLLGANTFEQIICQVHFKEPHDGAKFAPHLDFQNRISFDPQWHDVNGRGSYAVAVIAVDDHTIANGCLYTVPGIDSTVEPPRDKEALGRIVKESDRSRGIALEMKAGDVLFMHPYNLHWSSENTSNMSRFTLLSGMSSVGATAVDYPGLMCRLKARVVTA